jgi:hypothetical protein
LPNAGEFSAGNYFPTDKSVARVHVSVDRPGVLGPPWTNAGADRGHDGAPKLTGGGTKWRGKRGELGSSLTRALVALWRSGDDGAEQGGGGAR